MYLKTLSLVIEVEHYIDELLVKHFLQTFERLRTVNGIEPELIDKPWSTHIAFLLSF